MIYSILKPAKYNPEKHDAGTIHDWLEARGVDVQGVSITDTTIEIESTTDPREVIGSFDPPKSRAEQIEELFASADIDNATNAQLKQAVKLLVEYVTLTRN